MSTLLFFEDGRHCWGNNDTTGAYFASKIRQPLRAMGPTSNSNHPRAQVPSIIIEWDKCDDNVAAAFQFYIMDGLLSFVVTIIRARRTNTYLSTNQQMSKVINYAVAPKRFNEKMRGSAQTPWRENRRGASKLLNVNIHRRAQTLWCESTRAHPNTVRCNNYAKLKSDN